MNVIFYFRWFYHGFHSFTARSVDLELGSDKCDLDKQEHWIMLSLYYSKYADLHFIMYRHISWDTVLLHK